MPAGRLPPVRRDMRVLATPPVHAGGLPGIDGGAFRKISIPGSLGRAEVRRLLRCFRDELLNKSSVHGRHRPSRIAGRVFAALPPPGLSGFFRRMSSSRSTPRRSIVVPVPRPEKRAAAQPRRSMSAPDGVGTARRGASPSRGSSTSPVPCFPAIPPSVGRRFGRNPAISSTRSSNVRRTRIERTRPAFPRPSPRAHRPNVFALTSNSRARSEALAHVRVPLTARASSAQSFAHAFAGQAPILAHVDRIAFGAAQQLAIVAHDAAQRVRGDAQIVGESACRGDGVFLCHRSVHSGRLPCHAHRARGFANPVRNRAVHQSPLGETQSAVWGKDPRFQAV